MVCKSLRYFFSLCCLIALPSYAGDFYWGGKVAYAVSDSTDETEAVRASLPLDMNTDNDFSALMLGVFGGYTFNKWVAVEAEYSNHDGRARWGKYYKDTKKEAWANIENDVDRYAISWVPTFYQLSEDWNLYGRAGAAYTKTNYSDPGMSKSDGDSYAWGDIVEAHGDFNPDIYNFNDESEWNGILGLGGIFRNEAAFMRVEVRQDFSAMESTEFHLDFGYIF